MSDEEFYSEESYEFEFEDEDDNDEGSNTNDNDNDSKIDEDTCVDNMYYTAKGFKDDDQETAIEKFKKIVELKDKEPEDDDYEYIFKSHKQLMKLYFSEKNYDAMLDVLTELFTIVSKIDKSYFEDSISKMILHYSSDSNDFDFLNRFYNILLDKAQLNNVRLWFKINTNLLNLKIEQEQYQEIPQLLHQIYQKLKTSSESIQKSFTLQIIASEIEYLSKVSNDDNSNLARMGQLYRMSLKITTAVTHPKILAIIKECGGKVQFYRENFEKARVEFYESFKSYDEAGSALKYKLLKYVALCSLLTESELDPFESQETQTIAKSREFDSLKLLIKAYSLLDLQEFQTILVEQRTLDDSGFYKDPIFVTSCKEILKNLRSKILLNYIKGYSAIKFDFLCNQLKITESELEGLLLRLIMGGRLKDSKVDYVHKVIFTETNGSNKNSNRACFPQTSKKDIYYNVKLLEFVMPPQPAISQDDIMEVDENSPTLYSTPPKSLDYLHKFFFAIDRPTKPKDWFSYIESWYIFMMSAIPASHKGEISQKEQVINEQKAENITTSTSFNKAESELANFNTGLLNSTLAVEEENNDESDIEEINKVDVLNNWYGELKEYLNLIA
ncbi:COP9 signalosome complex subunit 2 [Candida viswanathii]|uniref:COP9 signalosome complex subunit 2 n=1 Tax=Candida viswanathii TaxID=5486 RepID=A0A367XMK9_9ASCO|nr:COP9 signalosome complex subunit 2 [Candida viswanathii]